MSSPRTLAIATACAGGFLAFLDTTIVNTAFPSIAASFSDASPADLSWVLDAYFIVMAALLVPAGGIADRVGRKRVFLAGVALFVPASLACALAPGWEVLVAARALQGAGAAVIVAVSLALILPLYPLERRAAAVATWGAAAALAAASGPLLGGLLTEIAGWRWVFVANLPLGVLVYVVGRRTIVESVDERSTGLPDLAGAALTIAGLGLLALAILEGGEWGWTSERVLAAFGAAAVLLALTAWRCRTHPRPVLDPALLRIASFRRANVGILLLGMAFFSTILANIIFLTVVWGYGILLAGLAVVPGALATTAVAVPAGRLADRHGHRAVIVPGCLLYVLGIAIVRGAGTEPDFLGTWLPAMLLNGAGLGLAFPALAAAALSEIPPERFASASAVQSAFRQFGGVLGTAALFAVGVPVTLAAAEDAYLVSTVWALGAGIAGATLNGRLPRSLSLGAVLIAAVLVFAAPAAADTNVTVGFETGPALDTPVTDEYRQSAFVFFQRSDAPRPYRLAAPGRARSGTTVANIGADLCLREVDDTIECEFPVGGTVGRLTRTASSIRLYAGLFQPSPDPVTVRLIAYRADGSEAATGAAVPVGTPAFTTEVRVTSAAADIARFRVEIGGTGMFGARVGFDDLTLTYPDNALPDVALSVAPGEAVVPQGGSVDVPVAVTRLNGSSGPLGLSATGLPPGVSAQFTGTTLRLRATANAPRTPLDVARDITIVGDPLGDGGVAPAPRSTKLPVRVSRSFDLVGPPTAAIPTCGSTELALRLEKDRAFVDAVRLEAKNLPAGVTATFTPGPEIPPRGDLHTQIKLRLSAATPIVAAPITVEATSPPTTRTLAVGATPGAPSATVRFPTGKLIAPRQLRPGNEVVLEGNFCEGTFVRVGNDAGTAPATVEDGGRTLRFTTPRLATSGPLTIIPPQGIAYTAAAPVEVDTFRSTKALPFENYGYGGLSLEEAEEVFGADELFVRINPCWPWGRCAVRLPIPDASALAVYQVIDWLMQNTDGHCFGFARAAQGWAQSPATLKRFTAAGSAFSITKTGGVSSYLDGQHATQASADFLAAYFRRIRDLGYQLETVRAELAAGRLPMITVSEDRSGHAVLAYDIVDQPDGSADILVYDSNVPFLGGELTSGGLHADRETKGSVVRIAPDRKSWELEMGATSWRGGDKTLFAFARNVIPDNATLPGLGLLNDAPTYVLFGSRDGAVRGEVGGDYLPPLDAAAEPGSGGAVRGISHTVRGVKAGRYRQALVGDGTFASVEATTVADAKDTVRAVDGGLAFAGDGPTRDVQLEVASAGRSGRVVTRTSGEDVVRLDGRKLVYAHDGAATTFSFTLRSTPPGGGSETFESGSLNVGRGDTVTAEPTRSGRVRLSVRDRTGSVRTRELRNRLRARAKLTVTRLSVRGGKARATVRTVGLSGPAAGAVVLRATRGGKAVARKVFTLARPENGSRTFTWRLPTRDVRLSAHATLAAGGTTVRTRRVAKH